MSPELREVVIEPMLPSRDTAGGASNAGSSIAGAANADSPNPGSPIAGSPKVNSPNADASITAAVSDFARLYDEHIDFVWRSAHQLGVAPDAADDVCQEVFITVFRQLAGFRAEASLKTWIFGILRNVVSNHRRGRRRRPGDAPLPTVDASDSLAQVPDRSETNPESILARQQEAELAQRVLDALPEESRLVLWLTDVEELSVPEVAAALAWNVNTTYTRLRAARREFSRRLDGARAGNGGPNGSR
ncbi:MAG TPA: sigma-70 family RNA polymerase sigma factor [Polyangiaceae bacterium]|nr:sigma-70 family RNA polymerase sigma factor [Polyangiaceae bacterium]